MTEHDLAEPLRRLADTAPAPAPGLADDIVERGRTTRRRRLGGLAAAGAAAVAALVVVVPLMVSGGDDRGSEPPVATDQPTETEPVLGPSARMQVAAAGVRAFVDDTYPGVNVLWVRDWVCEKWTNYVGGPKGCTDFTDSEVLALERLLPAYSITWVEDDRAPDGSHIGLDQHPPYVEISELDHVDSDGGSVFVWALRGARDCGGNLYHVTLRPDAFPVAKESGVSVIC